MKNRGLLLTKGILYVIAIGIGAGLAIIVSSYLLHLRTADADEGERIARYEELPGALQSFSEMSAVDLRRTIDAGEKVVVLDIRDREEFALEHIPTAKNIPADELEARALDELNKSDLIVTYCGCVNDNLSKLCYEDLKKDGFERLTILSDGIGGWKKAGFTTVKSR